MCLSATRTFQDNFRNFPELTCDPKHALAHYLFQSTEFDVMNGSFLKFMCVDCWAGVTCLRYKVLTSPNKDETAVYCCDPALSVLVRLVPRNVFQVVPVSQSIVSLLLYLRVETFVLN